MDLNAAKYPAEALFYTDIKSYEQNAGQSISKEANRLPALSCLPINSSWFWKKDFPTTPVKTAAELVNKNIVPLNEAYCNFILNVAPNTDGLIDDNTLATLKEIGQSWKNKGGLAQLPPTKAPLIASNIAKHQRCRSSWSDDMWIMDFANDDNFSTAWKSNKEVKQPGIV
jgi:alpha-L-fucosidase